MRPATAGTDPAAEGRRRPVPPVPVGGYRLAGDAALDAARRSLRTEGFAVLVDVDVADDAALLSVASGFGHVSCVGNGFPPRAIAEVRAETGTGGATLGSRRSGPFSLHTDSSGYPRPHDVVLLGCRRPDDDGGGGTLLVTVDDLVPEVPPWCVDGLGSAGFRFRAAVGRGESWLASPVLARNGGRYRLRYRRDEMRAAGSAAAALQRWDRQVARATPRSLLLAPGQVVVVDNLRMLHGRADFRFPSRRHLRRLKLYADSSREGPSGAPSLW